MTRAKITVGGDFERQAAQRFIAAWHRGKRGEKFRERHVAFENWEALVRALTNKRMELLRYVRRHNVKSVRALAKALERDYTNVHADVHALTSGGLLDATDQGLRADYDAIETKIAI